MADPLWGTATQAVTPEEAAMKGMMGLMRSKTFAKTLATKAKNSRMTNQTQLLSSLDSVDALDNARRTTRMTGTADERKRMKKVLEMRKQRRDRNFVRAKHACCRISLGDKGAHIGEELWSACGVAVTLSSDFHMAEDHVGAADDGGWEEARRLAWNHRVVELWSRGVVGRLHFSNRFWLERAQVA